jgi:MrfA Zn-binding domain
MSQRPVRPHGQVRQSQVLTTFGPGAMVDLPNHAVIIGGLEHWEGVSNQVFEERLTAKIQEILQVTNLKLYAPPIDLQDPNAPKTGITAWQFPEWFVAQFEVPWGDVFRSRPLLHRQALVDGRYLDRDRKKRPVVPVRFVQACINGHISDINWYDFVHRGQSSCKRQLWMDERGTSGDLADIFVRCECGQSRSLAEAAEIDKRPLGTCRGLRPWLGAASQEKCGGDQGVPEINRLLVRSASNAYFPQVLSVISIPDKEGQLRKAVDPIWEDFLQYVETIEDLRRERKKAKVFGPLEGLSDDDVFAEIQRRRLGAGPTQKTIKQAEIEMLMVSSEEIGTDRPEGDFYARKLRLPSPSPNLLKNIDRVVLVHRLREVIAQIGFTRFESEMPDTEGELSLNVRRANLALELSWLPAVENRGEGFFISVDPVALEAWVNRKAVVDRGLELYLAFKEWDKKNPGSGLDFPGLKYVFLHSLAHLLITAVTLECGYTAASIRERIYVGQTGYGILLYTGTPDAEGTLGGLVDGARHLDQHLANAMELGRLCSNDPVCAQHKPNNPQEERFLLGAACYGCLLIAEPSCERRNEFLDRALVVPTVEGLGAEFFFQEP